jgi:hypothetical protein
VSCLLLLRLYLADLTVWVATLYSALELRYNSFHVSQPASSSFPNVVCHPPAVPLLSSGRNWATRIRTIPNLPNSELECRNEFILVCALNFFLPPFLLRVVIFTTPSSPVHKNYSTKYTESFMQKIISKSLSSTMTNDTAADKSAYLQLKWTLPTLSSWQLAFN